MQSDEIKQDFIEFMEITHIGQLYPKSFFGVLMALFIEENPTTQDRIETLTGYSKTIVSQSLQSLQKHVPITVVNRPGTRKNFYSIELSRKEFMILFLRLIMDAYQDKTDFIPPLIDKISPYLQKNARFSIFRHFLEQFYKMSKLYLKIIAETAEDLTHLIRTGQIRAERILNHQLFDAPENLEFIKELMSPARIPPKIPENAQIDEKLLTIYAQLKDEYYRLFRLNLSSGESQVLVARSIIGTELLLENRPLTQEEIENATHLQRSIISEALNLLLAWNMVQLVKKKGDRRKYYVTLQSWDSRMIGKLRLNLKYTCTVKQKLILLIEKTHASNLTKERKPLTAFFQDLFDIYTQYEHYFKLLEWKFCEYRLQEHLQTKHSIRGIED